MKEIQIEEMKNIQLDILKFVDSLCHKHKINYSIFYGTLIGAIRHEGYIPWDDDIDIVLLRDDYNRLLEAFNNEHHQYYTFNTHQSSKHYFFPYGKVSDSRTVLTESGVNGTIGVNIDVFPIDFISDDVLTAESIIKQSAKIRKLLIVKRLEWRVDRRFWKNIMVLLFKFILSTVPIKVLTHKIHNIATHASVGFSNTVANIVWGAYLKKELLPYTSVY